VVEPWRNKFLFKNQVFPMKRANDGELDMLSFACMWLVTPHH
jgi:hypothetical protein